MRNGTAEEPEIAVVGGGLAGLAAAGLLARAGRSVVVLERSKRPGGRAITQQQNGFSFNLGPHALYRAGAGVKVLRELGVSFSGSRPPAAGRAFYRGAPHGRGALHRLPLSPWSLLATGLLGPAEKLEFGRIFARLRGINPASLHDTSMAAWLDANVRSARVRASLEAVVRVATYVNDPRRLSAGLAISQAQLALEGVDYLDDGWQTLVDGLRRAAEAAGARINISARVRAIEVIEAGERNGGGGRVRLDDGTAITPSAVIVAAGPDVFADLIEQNEETEIGGWADDAIPVRAACLDIGLSHLPNPSARFVLGIDQPLYLSVHSGLARLAPEGGAMIHVAKYLAPDGDDDPQAVERELEELLDLAQPGWRQLVIERRFLPNLVVANDMAQAARGGLPQRPGPNVPGVDNVYIAGDWVGPEGWLSDASLASAKRAVEHILRAKTPAVTSSASGEERSAAVV